MILPTFKEKDVNVKGGGASALATKESIKQKNRNLQKPNSNKEIRDGKKVSIVGSIRASEFCCQKDIGAGISLL